MKFFKNGNKKPKPVHVEKPADPVPRNMEEINKTYVELCKRAGELQYKIKIDQEQLSQINDAIRNVNHEAAARQKLDAETKEKEATQTTDSSGQVTIKHLGGAHV